MQYFQDSLCPSVTASSNCKTTAVSDDQSNEGKSAFFFCITKYAHLEHIASIMPIAHLCFLQQTKSVSKNHIIM